MKRLTASLILRAAALLAAGLPLCAGAQQPALNTPPPRPPVLEKLDEGQPPEQLIPPTTSQPKITEKREQGKVTQVQVQSGKSTYVVKANTQPGSIQPGEAQSTSLRVPQWQVMEFDWGMRKEKEKHQAETVPAPVPPPPPAAQ